MARTPLELGKLLVRRGHQERVVDGDAGIRRLERRVDNDAADAAAAESERGQRLDVDGAEWRGGGQLAAPDLLARDRVRNWEVHHETDAPEESAVDSALHVRGQDGQPAIGFE